MKTNLLNLLLILTICLLLSNVVSAQKPDIQRIYSELPDEFFSLKIFDEEPLFSLTTRNEFLSEEYLDSKDGIYKANLYDYNEYYESEDSDSNLTIYSDFIISIKQESGWASYKFEFEGNSNILDMIIVEKDSSSYLAIIEQYHPGMGVPAMVETNFSPIENSVVINEKHAIEIPQFDLSNFYAKKDFKKVNTKMLEGVKIPYLIDIEIIEGKANLSISPDLVALTWQMSQIMEFENNDELFEYERYMEAETILGLESLVEAKPVYVLLKDLMK